LTSHLQFVVESVLTSSSKKNYSCWIYIKDIKKKVPKNQHFPTQKCQIPSVHTYFLNLQEYHFTWGFRNINSLILDYSSWERFHRQRRLFPIKKVAQNSWQNTYGAKGGNSSSNNRKLFSEFMDIHELWEKFFSENLLSFI
jgi:hypothetical protein